MTTKNKPTTIYPQTDDNIVSIVTVNNTICIGKINSSDDYGILFDGLLALQMFEENKQVKFMFAPFAAAGKDFKTSKTFIPHSSIICFYEMEDSLINTYREVTNRIQIVGSIARN